MERGQGWTVRGSAAHGGDTRLWLTPHSTTLGAPGTFYRALIGDDRSSREDAEHSSFALVGMTILRVKCEQG